jgi:hypothetical protein
MREIKGHTEKTWYVISKNNHGFVEVGQVLTTGEGEIETFDTEESYDAKVLEINN